MNVWRRHGARLAAVLGLVLLLNACGGGGWQPGHMPASLPGSPAVHG